MANKRLFVVLLLVAMLGLFVGNLQIKEAKAVPIEVTRTFYAEAGEIWDTLYWNDYDGSYLSARNSSSGGGWGMLFVGQECVAELNYFYVYRGFCFFDTNIVPDDATITTMILSVYLYQNLSVTDFNITIQNGGIYPHFPLEYNDYNYAYYTGDGGQFNTSSLIAGYNNITLNDQGKSWINRQGLTKLCLRSDKDINATQPTTAEYVGFYQREDGEAKTPKLYVTYTTEGYHYIVHGPYFEDGSVATNTVNLTFQIENLPFNSYVLNGTDLDIQVEQRGVAFTWNFSSYMNYTRTYYLTSATFEEIWIFIPKVTDEAINLYSFTVTDFVGVTNAYLETVHNIGGQNRIVERQRLDVINAVPFWMVWAHRYDIRLVCDQGTYVWGGFLPISEMQQNLIIVAGMFPISYPGLDITVKAKRMNATWIQINYTDNQLLTSSVAVTIQYRKGMGWETAYTTTNPNNTQQINWYSAVSSTDYVVGVAAYRNGEQKTWSFSCPKPSVAENPWEPLDALGSWPIPPQYIIGLVLTIVVFGLCSYANIGAGCVLGTLMASILTYMGWLPCPWPLLALAWVISIFVALAEAKKHEREVEI